MEVLRTSEDKDKKERKILIVCSLYIFGIILYILTVDSHLLFTGIRVWYDPSKYYYCLDAWLTCKANVLNFFATNRCVILVNIKIFPRRNKFGLSINHYILMWSGNRAGTKSRSKVNLVPGLFDSLPSVIYLPNIFLVSIKRTSLYYTIVM